MSSQNDPITILGAGPVGLAAAAHLIRRGEEPLLLEAGATVGASMAQWGHVRLFSPWRYLIDQQAQALLSGHDWQAPNPETYPTAHEIVEQYLFPLARLPQIQAALHLETRVLAVSRARMDKVKTPGREASPYAQDPVKRQRLLWDLIEWTARAGYTHAREFLDPDFSTEEQA